jgi:hypothetical protein
MPRLSIWFVRCSLIHLFLGFTLGGLILANKGFPFIPWIWNLLPAHMEFLLVGWMVQFAMGVAFWILPRFRSGPPRGNTNLIRAAFALLNAGIIMVAIQPCISINWLAASGRFLEISSVLLFILASWPRVKPMEL